MAGPVSPMADSASATAEAYFAPCPLMPAPLASTPNAPSSPARTFTPICSAKIPRVESRAIPQDHFPLPLGNGQSRNRPAQFADERSLRRGRTQALDRGRRCLPLR